MQFTGDTALAIVGIIIGMVATVMAAPPLFQMMWGRPEIEVNVDEFTGTNEKSLIVSVKNKLIANKFLRWIGVEREIGIVSVFFDIQELGTGKYIAKNMSSLAINTATRERGLTSEVYPAFTIGAWIISQTKEIAQIVDGTAKPGAPLKVISEGNYLANIVVIRAGNHYSLDKEFKIGKLQHETHWIG